MTHSYQKSLAFSKWSYIEFAMYCSRVEWEAETLQQQYWGIILCSVHHLW